MKKIEFIDVHVHGFLKPADKHRFKENITVLIDQGLEKIIITALPYHNFDYHLKLSLAPDHIQPVIGTDNVDETTLLADWTREYGFDKIQRYHVGSAFNGESEDNQECGKQSVSGLAR